MIFADQRPNIYEQMSLESVFANPPPLVGLANKESGEEAKERTPFFYDDDEDTQEYDPEAMMAKFTPQEDLPPALPTEEAAAPEPPPPEPPTEEEPDLEQDAPQHDAPPTLEEEPMDMTSQDYPDQEPTSPRPGHLSKSPSHEGRSHKSRSSRRRHRGEQKHRHSRRHRHTSGHQDEAPQLDREDPNELSASDPVNAVDPGDLEDGELEDGEIDDVPTEQGPPQLSPHRPGRNSPSDSESDTENKPREDEESGDENESKIKAIKKGEAGGENEAKKKNNKKKRHEKRKRKKEKEKAKKKRAKYTDHDQVDTEDGKLSWPAGPGRPPAGPDAFHRLRGERSPPGPYDSPYDSPPGPYDSPSDEDDYGPPAKIMRKSSKKQQQQQQQQQQQHQQQQQQHQQQQSMLSMLSGEYTEGPLTPLEKEEMFQQMRIGSNKMKKMEKGRLYKEIQQQHRRDKKQMPPKQKCKFYMEGKCAKGKNCTFSHDFKPPRKTEVCKFYINDMCAKGKDCVYMHSDYPCKYYHMGQECLLGDDCKFSHDPLDDHTRPIFEKIVHEEKDFVTMMIQQQHPHGHNQHGQPQGPPHLSPSKRGHPQQQGYDNYMDYGPPGPQQQQQQQQQHQHQLPPQQLQQQQPPSQQAQPPPSDLKKIPSLFDIEVFPPRKPDGTKSGDDSPAEGEGAADGAETGRTPDQHDSLNTGPGDSGADNDAAAASQPMMPGQGPMSNMAPHNMGPRGPMPPRGPMGGPPPPGMLGRPPHPGIMGAPPAGPPGGPLGGPRGMGGPMPPRSMAPGSGMPPLRPPRFYGDMSTAGPPPGLPPQLAHQPGLLGPPPGMLRPPRMAMPPGMHPLAGPGGDPRGLGPRPPMDTGYYGEGPPLNNQQQQHQQQQQQQQQHHQMHKNDTIQSPEPEPRILPMPNLDHPGMEKGGDHSGFGADDLGFLSNLPPKQRELFLRIQQQQRQNVPEQDQGQKDKDQVVEDDNWYSSDDEEESGPPKSNLANLLQTLSQGQGKAPPTPQPAPAAPPNMPFDIAKVLNVIQSHGMSVPPPQQQHMQQPQAPAHISSANQGMPNRDPRQAAGSTAPPSRPDPRLRPSSARLDPRADPRLSPRADPRSSPRAETRGAGETRADPRLKTQTTMPIEQLVIPLNKQPDHYNPRQASEKAKQRVDSDVVIHCPANGTHDIPYMMRKMVRSLPEVPSFVNPADPRYRDDPRVQRQASHGKAAVGPGPVDPRAFKRQSSNTSHHDPRAGDKMDPRLARSSTGGSSPRPAPAPPRHLDPRVPQQQQQQQQQTAKPLTLHMPKPPEDGPQRAGDPRMARTTSAPPPLSPAPALSDPRQAKALGLPAFSTGPRDSPPMPSLPPFIPPKPSAPLQRQTSGTSPSHSPHRDDAGVDKHLSHRNDPRFKKKQRHDMAAAGLSPNSNSASTTESRSRPDPRKTFEHRSPLDAGSKSLSEPMFGSFNRTLPPRGGDPRMDGGPAAAGLPRPARHLGMPQINLPMRQNSQPSGGGPLPGTPRLAPASSTGGMDMYPGANPKGQLEDHLGGLAEDPDQNVRDVFKTIDPTASPFC